MAKPNKSLIGSCLRFFRERFGRSNPAKPDHPSFDLNWSVQKGPNPRALDRALGRLQRHNNDQYELVLLRFFSRYELDEAAEQLGFDKTTAHFHWIEAMRFLKQALESKDITQSVTFLDAPPETDPSSEREASSENG